RLSPPRPPRGRGRGAARGRGAPAPRFPLFFFNETATTEIYTLSLHDALPICGTARGPARRRRSSRRGGRRRSAGAGRPARSEEHTSEIQSLTNLARRLLL